jgi:diguanylate cyclase (GGDEF)-like protein
LTANVIGWIAKEAPGSAAPTFHHLPVQETSLAMNRNDGALLELIERIEQLGQFQDKIDFPSSIDQIWQVFRTDLANLIEVQVDALFLVDDKTREFRLVHCTPADMSEVCRKEIDLQIECGIFSWVIHRRKPALIPALAFKDVNSVVMMPLATVKRTVGAVMAATPVNQDLITQETLKLLSILTKQCALVVENTRLYERLRNEHESLEKANREISILYQTDSLTGCYNRGYLNEHLPREIKRALRYRHPLSLAMCDLDHFKAINDNYGHQCGDDVLKAIVRHIQELIRVDADWLARYGGEEFLLVLPETKIDHGCLLAERLRAHLAKLPIHWAEGKLTITASFGVTGFDGAYPPERLTPDNLIAAADRCLYRAKNEGRNRVVGELFKWTLK